MSKEKPKKSLVSFQAEDELQNAFDEITKRHGITRSFALRQLMKIYIKEDGNMELIIHEKNN